MSPGAGLRPSPPPLLRTQAPLPPRIRHPRGLGTGSRLSASRAAGRHLDKVMEEATTAGGRRGTFVQTPATCAAAQTFAVAVAVDAGVVERWRERGLAANVPRRRPAAVTSSFTSHPAPAPSACQASRRPRHWLSTTRKPSRCVGGRRLDKVKEEATAAGGRRGTFVQTPATRAAARTLAMRVIEAQQKNPGRCRGFSFGTARAPYFFFGMYRSVIVPS